MEVLESLKGLGAGQLTIVIVALFGGGAIGTLATSLFGYLKAGKELPIVHFAQLTEIQNRRIVDLEAKLQAASEERSRAEVRASVAESRYSAISNTLASFQRRRGAAEYTGVVHVHSGAIYSVNQAFLDLIGMDKSALEGTSFQAILGGDSFAKISHALSNVKNGKSSARVEDVNLLSSQEVEIPVVMTVSGTEDKFICIAYPIVITVTDIAKTEREITAVETERRIITHIETKS